MADRGATRDFWVELFDERPDVLHQLLGDIYLITKAHRDEPRGGRRRGKAGEGNLTELLEMVTPTFSNKAFPEAIKDLMGGMSVRAFAPRTGIPFQSLQRLINGDRPLERLYDPKGSMRLLEQIAAGGKVHPSYFMEWRRLWLMMRLDDALAAKPNLSVGLFRKYATLSDENKRRVG